MKKGILRKSALVLSVILTVLIAICWFAGNYMCNYALCPEEHGQMLEEDRAKWEGRVPGIMDWYDALHEGGIFKDTVITDSNGLRLHAVYASAAVPDSAAGTAVLVHGYTDNHLCVMMLGRMYRDDLNWNVLIPDLHHHGLSEGDAIQMGWLDRLDVIRWTEAAHDIWRNDKMVIHGVSMGGATTMMVSGEELPGYVRGFIDDCGYSSVWNQFAKELKEGFHLPAFPVLTSANLVCKARYGWSFKEASSLRQLAKCTRPMLFIHGDSDDYVPTSDVYLNFEAKTQGDKYIWIAPETGHAYSYVNHPEEYTAQVREFLGKI